MSPQTPILSFPEMVLIAGSMFSSWETQTQDPVKKTKYHNSIRKILLWVYPSLSAYSPFSYWHTGRGKASRDIRLQYPTLLLYFSLFFFTSKLEKSWILIRLHRSRPWTSFCVRYSRAIFKSADLPFSYTERHLLSIDAILTGVNFSDGRSIYRSILYVQGPLKQWNLIARFL